MSPLARSLLLALAGTLLAPAANAQSPTITAAPLVTQRAPEKRQDSTSTCNFDLVEQIVPYNQIPYQVDNCTDGRGPQTGYNLCNSTTQNQESQCQTIFMNNLADFCVWGPPDPNTSISDSEGYEVVWCTKDGHGTRLIPDGALQGVQFLRTPNYLQVVGFIDQTMINMQADDEGGELDGRGQDNRGNPMGGLAYTNAYNSSNYTYTQMLNWQWFMGSDVFCAKVCPGAAYDTEAYSYCFNQDDEVGCDYNMPNAAQNGTFEVCDADNALPVGVYVTNGVTSTWTQGFTGFSTIPYTPIPPSSSNCRTYASSDLYTDLKGVQVSTMPASLTATSYFATASPTPSTSKPTTSAAGSRTGSGSGSAASATTTASSGAVRMGGSVPAAGLLLLGVVAGMMLLA